MIRLLKSCLSRERAPSAKPQHTKYGRNVSYSGSQRQQAPSPKTSAISRAALVQCCRGSVDPVVVVTLASSLSSEEGVRVVYANRSAMHIAGLLPFNDSRSDLSGDVSTFSSEHLDPDFLCELQRRLRLGGCAAGTGTPRPDDTYLGLHRPFRQIKPMDLQNSSGRSRTADRVTAAGSSNRYHVLVQAFTYEAITAPTGLLGAPTPLATVSASTCSALLLTFVPDVRERAPSFRLETGCVQPSLGGLTPAVVAVGPKPSYATASSGAGPLAFDLLQRHDDVEDAATGVIRDGGQGSILAAPDKSVLAGDPAVLSGDPAVLAGDPAVLAGDPAVLAGDPAVLAGDPAVLAGDPAAVPAAVGASFGAEELRLRANMVLSGLTPIVTAFSVCGREVVYQNEASIAFYGSRSRLTATIVDTTCTTSGSTVARFPEPSPVSVLADLFRLEPNKLERLHLDVGIEGKAWRGLVRVPSSCMPKRAGSDAAWGSQPAVAAMESEFQAAAASGSQPDARRPSNLHPLSRTAGRDVARPTLGRWSRHASVVQRLCKTTGDIATALADTAQTCAGGDAADPEAATQQGSIMESAEVSRADFCTTLLDLAPKISEECSHELGTQGPVGLWATSTWGLFMEDTRATPAVTAGISCRNSGTSTVSLAPPRLPGLLGQAPRVPSAPLSNPAGNVPQRVGAAGGAAADGDEEAAGLVLRKRAASMTSMATHGMRQQSPIQSVVWHPPRRFMSGACVSAGTASPNAQSFSQPRVLAFARSLVSTPDPVQEPLQQAATGSWGPMSGARLSRATAGRSTATRRFDISRAANIDIPPALGTTLPGITAPNTGACSLPFRSDRDITCSTATAFGILEANSGNLRPPAVVSEAANDGRTEAPAAAVLPSSPAQPPAGAFVRTSFTHRAFKAGTRVFRAVSRVASLAMPPSLQASISNKVNSTKDNPNAATAASSRRYTSDTTEIAGESGGICTAGSLSQQRSHVQPWCPAPSPVIGYCWHEVTATRRTDPVTGAYAIIVTQTDVTSKVEAERHLALVTEAEHCLLEQIFPRHILAALAEEGGPLYGKGCTFKPAISRDIDRLATSHSEVTLLFADIQGFTPMCKELPPCVVMTFLNDLFTQFDNRLDDFGVYKVETIGDCYFVAGGLIHEDEQGMPAVRARDSDADPLHAERVFMFAKAMVEAASNMTLPTTGDPVRMRIGIHTGPVVSGVVGTRMPRFCLFGDTVNTASRMESTGVPGWIHASEETRKLLRKEVWVPTGGIEVKGKGLMNTFLWAPPDRISQEALLSCTGRHTAEIIDIMVGSSNSTAGTKAHPAGDTGNLPHSTSRAAGASATLGSSTSGEPSGGGSALALSNHSISAVLVSFANNVADNADQQPVPSVEGSRPQQLPAVAPSAVLQECVTLQSW